MRDRHLVKMSGNYHHEFGSCLLLEQSTICKKCDKFKQIYVYRGMQQHILGVMSNVMYCLVANLTDFPAVKEF